MEKEAALLREAPRKQGSDSSHSGNVTKETAAGVGVGNGKGGSPTQRLGEGEGGCSWRWRQGRVQAGSSQNGSQTGAGQAEELRRLHEPAGPSSEPVY